MTERNLGILSSDSKTNALKSSTENEYESAVLASKGGVTKNSIVMSNAEDGDTERRHFSSLPGNQSSYASSSH